MRPVDLTEQIAHMFTQYQKILNNQTIGVGIQLSATITESV